MSPPLPASGFGTDGPRAGGAAFALYGPCVLLVLILGRAHSNGRRPRQSPWQYRIEHKMNKSRFKGRGEIYFSGLPHTETRRRGGAENDPNVIPGEHAHRRCGCGCEVKGNQVAPFARTLKIWRGVTSTGRRETKIPGSPSLVRALTRSHSPGMTSQRMSAPLCESLRSENSAAFIQFNPATPLDFSAN